MQLQYQYRNVCVEALSYTLPEEVVSSEQIEIWLAPLYERLRLPEGRLELMTGINRRLFWPPGTLPGQKSIETAEKVIRLAQIDKAEIGALVHGSVCRDYLEPATASGVHHGLGLSRDCMIYDVSNACLGLLDGMVQVANMIELGQIRAGLVVGTESSRSLVETTIKQLNADQSLSRNDIKMAVASLTIGSGSAAVLLTDRELSRTENRLVGGTAYSNTDFCHLCRSDQQDAAGTDMQPVMHTDSAALMREGIEAARAAFTNFLDTVGWDADEIDRTFCHQVGRAHSRLLFESLGLNPAIDYPTVEFLGNTGSVALPTAAALGIEKGLVNKNDRVALLGIGSGINVLMLGVQWQRSLVERKPTLAGPHAVVKSEL